jgi:serine phosphatase RsbU (regulator of sigma subunit)
VTRARLLVVDDVEANRDLLARRLRRLGHEVASVADGAAALAHVAREDTDLVLLDVMMPGLSGYDVLARLKADPALRHVPVVMVSALDELASVVRCLELGAEDYLPKPFEPAILRARVEATLEKKRLRDGERRWARQLERELEIGREIQAGFLPDTLPTPPGWELAAVFEAARQVSGDFYDAFALPGGQVALVVGDVCGKGVGAALFMALFRTLIRASATAEPAGDGDGAARVCGALRAANDYIAHTHGAANMFATVFAAALDPATGVLDYVNAGHEAPFVVAADGGVRAELAPTGPAVGMFPDAPFALASARLAPGEAFLVHTDGAGEARDPAGGFFGDARLRALCDAPAGGAADLAARVRDAVHAFAAGAEPADDLTLLAVRRAPAPGRAAR